MCFSSGGGTVKPKPANPLSRFDYNQPVNQGRTQQQQVAAANTDTQPAFGSDLGATPEQRY
jgi:hypothetical protein